MKRDGHFLHNQIQGVLKMLGLSLFSTVRKLRNEIAAERERYIAEMSAKDQALESLSKLSDVRLDVGQILSDPDVVDWL